MTSCESLNNKKYLLVLNGVEDYLQVVLGTKERLLWAWQAFTFQKGMLFLGPQLEYLFSSLAISPNQLKSIVLVSGPGSFTGLRLTFAHAYGLALGAQVPLGSIEYLPLVAKSIPLKKEIWVLTYSRQKEVYIQGFDSKKSPLTPPKAINLSQAQDILKKRPSDIILTGSGLRKHPQILSWGFTTLEETFDTPLPQVLLKEAFCAKSSSNAPLPIYLRASNAEDNLEKIIQQTGLSLKEAQKKLFSGSKIS